MPAIVHPVALALCFAMSAPAPEQLYAQGQDLYEARDYPAAAEAWTRLLATLGESEKNRAIRESVVINMLEASLAAHKLVLKPGGGRDIEHLRRAKATLSAYFTSYTAVHGTQVALDATVEAKAAELDAALEAAEKEEARRLEQERLRELELERKRELERPRQIKRGPAEGKPARSKLGREDSLIVAGSVSAALGVGAVAMIPIGSIRGRAADALHTDASARLVADPNDAGARQDIDRAEFEGKQANDVLIAGAVLAPLLLASGATMIAIGIRDKRNGGDRRRGFTPMLDRTTVGITFQARF